MVSVRLKTISRLSLPVRGKAPYLPAGQSPDDTSSVPGQMLRSS